MHNDVHPSDHTLIINSIYLTDTDTLLKCFIMLHMLQHDIDINFMYTMSF